MSDELLIKAEESDSKIMKGHSCPGRNCGQAVPDDISYCPNCGTSQTFSTISRTHIPKNSEATPKSKPNSNEMAQDDSRKVRNVGPMELMEKADDEEEEQDEEDQYPEIWFIFDGMGTYLGQIAYDATGNFHAQITKDERNEYFEEIFTFLRPLGSDAIDLSHSALIVDVDKEEALDAVTEAGFMAKKATDEDHEEIIRELDKLSTIKGGESKRYSRTQK